MAAGLGGAEVDAQRDGRAACRAQAVERTLFEVGSVHGDAPLAPPAVAAGSFHAAAVSGPAMRLVVMLD